VITVFALQAEKQVQGSTAAMALWSSVLCPSTSGDQGYDAFSYCPFSALAPIGKRHNRRHSNAFSTANMESWGVLSP
jgi:hypothetical protein